MDRPESPPPAPSPGEPTARRTESGGARGGTFQVIRDRTAGQTALLVVSFVALIVSWSLIWNILLDTPIIDITGLEPTLLVGGLLLVLVGAWSLIRPADARWWILVAVYLGWLLIASFTQSPQDIKKAVAYLFFFGVSLAVAFVAVRLDPPRAARWLVRFFAVVLVVALLGAILEHLTYPPPGAADPLDAFWSLFRRRVEFVDPNVGVFRPNEAHYPLGQEGVFRTAGVFAHPVYLAFFGLLAAAVMTGALLVSWRRGARLAALAFLVGLGMAIVVTYWTYSRAPLAAVVGLIPLMALAEIVIVARRAARRPKLADFAPGALAILTLVVVLGTSVALDNAGLRRLAGTQLGAELDSEVSDDDIVASSARTTALRLVAQRLAVDMLLESPRALVTGTGLAAYEVAIATGPNRGGSDPISHPHNAWLTEMLGGGIPAAILFALVLASTSLGALRATARTRNRARAALLLGLGIWIPIWAGSQLVGLHPFMAHEAVILGSMLGFTRGLTVPADEDEETLDAREAAAPA